jgi:hypothetical protein
MAQGHQFIIFSIIAIVLIIILSTCNSYPLFNELPSMYKSIKIFKSLDDCYSSRTSYEI